MSVKVNKKSLKQQGGQMIPEGPGMMEQSQPQVDEQVMQITEVIKSSMDQGMEIVDIIKGLMEQQVDQQVIGQALMMGGMEQEDIITVFEKVNEPPQPSSPQEVDANPQLLARNKAIAEAEEGQADQAAQQELSAQEQIMMGKSGIEIKPENKGKFTAWAKKRGMSVGEAYRKVLANKDKYPPSIVKMANFARNASKWNKGQEGLEIPSQALPVEDPSAFQRMQIKLRDLMKSNEVSQAPYDIQGMIPPGYVPNPMQTLEYRDVNQNGIEDRDEGIYQQRDLIREEDLPKGKPIGRTIWGESTGVPMPTETPGRRYAQPKLQEGGETIDDYYQDKDGNVDIQELDEVVVTADNRSPLQKLSDFAFVNEEDSFLTKHTKNYLNPLLQIDNILQASSIPANLVREVIQGVGNKGDGEFNAGDIIPDFYNTTILTGDDKQIPVSETLGIDNWAGALLTDLALDPATYVGVGALRNLGTKAAKNLAPKAAKFLGNTGKNLKRAPGFNTVDDAVDYLQRYKDDLIKFNSLSDDVKDDLLRGYKNNLSDDVVEDLKYKGEVNDYLKEYGQFENESVSEMLKNPEIPEYVKDELRDLQYFKSGNIPGRGPVELRKILEDSGLSPDNFQEGGEKGEYVNGVFIPKESDVSKDALRNSLSRDKNIYMSNQNFSVAPLSPPPQTNVLYDFLNTASTINQELFSNELDAFGNRKGALKDIRKRGDGKFLGLNFGEGNPDQDGPSKMDIHKATKPFYYDYEVTNMDELTSDQNKMAYVNWALSQVKDWNEATEKQKQEEQQTIQEQTGLDVSEDDAPESQTFEEWALSQGKNPAEMSDLTRQTMENLWKRTLGLKQFGGGVPFMTPGFNPYENDGGFNPYEDDFGRFLQQGMQTDYMRDTMNTVPPRSQSNDNISQADEIFGEDGVVVTPDDDKEKTTDELFEEINFTPEFNVTNKVEGFVTRLGDNPYVRAATSLSKAGVDTAGFLNRIYDRRNYNRALDQLEERSGADYKYGVVMQDPFSEGFYDVNSGQLQGEAERTPGYYMSFAGSPNSYNMSAKEGGEFKPHMMYDPESGRGYEAKVPADHERMAKMGYLHKDEMKQGGEVVELSQDMIAQLIAAGADIEIL